MITNRIKQLFSPLSVPERADYTALLCIAITLPISWRIALLAIIAFAVTSIVMLCHSRELGWKSMPTGQRITACLMILFFIIYLISGGLSENQSRGWSTTEHKLAFIIFPIIFLLSNKKYLGRDRLRFIFFLLWATITLRFFFELCIVLIQCGQGIPFKSLVGEHFGTLHHTYYALYAMVGAAFVYSELMSRIEHNELDKKSLMLFLALLPSFATVVITDSRTGIICAVLLILIGLFDYIFCKKQWKKAFVCLVAITSISIVVYRISPYQRFGVEWEAITSGQESERMTMLRSAVETAAANPLWGYGSGDYEEPLQQQYLKNGYQMGFDNKQDSHNQYLETMLQCGIFGTITLIAMLLVPIISALRSKTGRRLVCSSIMVISVSIFFESMLGRQMGILFICYVLILLPIYCRRETQLNLQNNLTQQSLKPLHP